MESVILSPVRAASVMPLRAYRRVFVRRNRKSQHKGANTMYKITEKVALNPTVTKMVIEAPLIAKKAKPGQFIIVRPFEAHARDPECNQLKHDVK